MTITVQLRDVYGNRLVYPVCDTAKRFAAIAGTKTLSPLVLAHIKDMGVEVQIEQVTL